MCGALKKQDCLYTLIVKHPGGKVENKEIANNWDSVEAATSADPFRPTSTQGGGSGGGSGFTVFYGVAVRDLHDASLCHPPRRVLHRLRRARD
jgi:hypothetical protein